MPYKSYRKFSRNNLALFSACAKIGLRVSAGQRKMANGDYALVLDVSFIPKGEYLPLGEKLEQHELGDAIFHAYLTYYTMIRNHGSIKYKETHKKSMIDQDKAKEEAEKRRNHKCRYIKKKGASCSLNNNCRYPNCDDYEQKEQSKILKFKL